ncbi:MAG: tyrosine-type recombinase/integrase [Lachnospiraceae bacterium]|nr:tyrosine-type recombinase/integrase [Lachnospiraceae bacterium]
MYQQGNVVYGVFVEKVKKKATLGELIHDWNQEVNFIHNSETTWKFNENLQRHILGFFSHNRLLEEIGVKEITEYFSFLKRVRNFSNNTINKHRTHLMTLFEYATRNDERYGIEINPVRKIRPLRHEPYAYKIYSPEEAKKMMRILHKTGKVELEVAVALALYCGCRREEVCGLRWENVNMLRKEITITEIRTIAGREVVHHMYTKNNTIRVVGIPDALYDILKIVKQYQEEQQKRHKIKSPYEYVLSEDNGLPWHPSNVTMRWKNFLEKNKLRVIRFHDLRHTNLSLLMSKMSAIDVAKLGGHAKVSTTTNIYGHSFTDTVERGKEVINKLL